MSSTELSILPSKDEWAQIKELAHVAVKSGLLPTAIKTPEAAAIIILKGRELGMPPMVAFSHISVIQGKPTLSAEIMLAYIYKDFPLANITFVETTEDRCEIHAGRAAKVTKFVWDVEKARKMGLLDKDNWKKQRGTMLRWRCITEMKRIIFPEVLMGIDYSPEELGATVSAQGVVKDVTPPEPPVVKTVQDLMAEEVPAEPMGESSPKLETNLEKESQVENISSVQNPPKTIDSPSSGKPEIVATVAAPNTSPPASETKTNSQPVTRTQTGAQKTRAELQKEAVDLMTFIGWDTVTFMEEAQKRFGKSPTQFTDAEMVTFIGQLKEEVERKTKP